MTRNDEQIARILTVALLAGRLAPGLKLGEHQLAGIFGVTRERIRRVLHRLGAQRLIELVPNRGAFVADPGLRQARQIYEARRIFESGVVAHLAETLTERQIARLEDHLKKEFKARHEANRTESIRLSGVFHALLAELTGNALVVKDMHELVSRTAMLVAYHEAGSSNCSCTEHEAIVQALVARDCARAIGEMRTHLSLIETRLQMAPVASHTEDLETVLREEIGKWDAANADKDAPPPRRARRKRAGAAPETA